MTERPLARVSMSGSDTGSTAHPQRIYCDNGTEFVSATAEERPALQPLPVEPFRYYRFGVRSVHLDGCVEVEAAYYSTPPGWIGQRVQVQWTDLHVRVLAPTTGRLLREHVRASRGWHRIADCAATIRSAAQRQLDLPLRVGRLDCASL